jgi:hypothetical protein
MCAVWGGTYMLRRTVRAQHIDSKEADLKNSNSTTTNISCNNNDIVSGDNNDNNDNNDCNDNSCSKTNHGEAITYQDINIIDVDKCDKENNIESLSINDVKECDVPFLIINNGNNNVQPLPITNNTGIKPLLPLLITVEDPTLCTTKEYKCKAFLTNSDSYPPSSVVSNDNVHPPVIRSSLTSRVLICVNKVEEIKGGKPGEGCMLLPLSRSISIIPPNSKDINNKNAIYILQLDSSSLVCPDGYHLIYLSTETPTNMETFNNNNYNGNYDNNYENNHNDSNWDTFIDQNSSILCGEFDKVIEAVITSKTTNSYFSSFIAATNPNPNPSSSYNEPLETSEKPSSTSPSVSFLPSFLSSTPPSKNSKNVSTLPTPTCSDSLPSFLSSTPSIPTSSPSFLIPPTYPDNPDKPGNLINDTIQIISSTTTIRPLYQSSSNPEKLPSNIAVSYDTTSTIHCEEQFIQAESIFNRLFPTETFFSPIIAENEDDEDNI